MRLIDADALKDSMKNAVVRHICTNTLYNTIMAVIDGSPTVQSERWIPCSERLPEKEELVLVTVWNDVVIAWRNRYGGWESVEDMYEKGDVIAWMPLPKPHRKESEVEE